jgi:protein phosphatase
VSVLVELFGRTDVGLSRTSNEDSFAISDLDGAGRLELAEPTSLSVAGKGPLFVVCDGMGGAAAGEIASSLAVEVMIAEMREAPATDDRAVYARHLRRAVRTANRRVFEEAGQNWKLRGMGTTLSAAGLVGDVLVIAQVGDSRAYIQRGDTLVQVTRDQSIVSALLHAGRITEEEAKNFVQSNVILQALGVSNDVDVALSVVDLRKGDRLVICSDGLHGPVGDDGIRDALLAHTGAREAVDELVRLANEAGGPDNITAVVARFDGDRLPPAANPDDLPRFVEFDPMEEGPQALTTTSRVARRLAAKAGVGEDSGAVRIPATGQYAAVARDVLGFDDDGPAQAALADRSRLGWLAWVLAVAAIVAAVAFLVLAR